MILVINTLQKDTLNEDNIIKQFMHKHFKAPQKDTLP